MKALLLDIGNTRIKWGISQAGCISKTGHIAQSHVKEQGLAALTSKLPADVDTALASNTAGATFATRLSGVVGAHCGCDVHFAHVEKQAYGVTNSYRVPRRMGVDRWVAMIGAWAELEKSCVIVDAGTAVTIDVLDGDGKHLGGEILPGYMLMTSVLAQETSDLPELAGRAPNANAALDIFASDTKRAIQNGAWNAVIGAVARAMNVLKANRYRPQLVLTGGDASRMLDALGETALHRPHLVLQGLARMLD
jgi:type III pantothenate kinase